MIYFYALIIIMIMDVFICIRQYISKKKKHNQFEINLSIMLQLGLSVSNMCL